MPTTQPRKGRAPRSKPVSPSRLRGIGRPRAGSVQAVGREALITQACDMLTRLPASQVTRAALARSVGVDASLIRYYFRNRAALLLAAVERLTRRFVTDVEGEQHPTGAGGEVQELLRARLISLLRLNFHYPHFHNLIVDELATMSSGTAKKLLQRLTQRGLDSYGSIVHAGVRDGSLRDVDIRFLFIAIIGMTHFFTSGAAIVRIAMREEAYGKGLMEQYGTFLFDVLLNGLAAQPKR